MRLESPGDKSARCLGKVVRALLQPTHICQSNTDLGIRVRSYMGPTRRQAGAVWACFVTVFLSCDSRSTSKSGRKRPVHAHGAKGCTDGSNELADVRKMLLTSISVDKNIGLIYTKSTLAQALELVYNAISSLNLTEVGSTLRTCRVFQCDFGE